jgi:hypothetical protein
MQKKFNYKETIKNMNANITISDYQKKFYSKRKSDKEEFTF